MRIAICDDDRLFLEQFRAQVEELDFARKIDCYSALNQFIYSLDDSAPYDAVLMDIDWKQDETGIDAAEMLYQCSPQTKVIYVTGYNDLFPQHIFLQKSNLSGYLVKPVDSELLRANLEKVLAAQDEQPVLTIQSHGRPISIPHREIVYLESLGHTVTIHTQSETVTVYEQLDKLRPLLSEGFIQCHKSFLVNMRYIRRFLSQDILLVTDAQIPISRSKYARTKDAYFRYMGKMF